MEQLLREWRELEQQIRQGGGASKIARQHKEGKFTARERIAKLVDAAAPVYELGLLMAYDKYDGQAPDRKSVV